jgi:hypothetical protein
MKTKQHDFFYRILPAPRDNRPADDEVRQMVGKPLEAFGVKEI